MLLIRQYQSHDREAVWALHNRALLAIGAHAGNGAWDDDLHHIETAYLSSSGEFLVGIGEGQLVAMGALKRITMDRAEIKRMRVDPAHQRRGFGQALLTALERRAVELGYTLLQLDTTVQQEAAQRLYARNGFRAVRRTMVGSWECIVYEKGL